MRGSWLENTNVTPSFEIQLVHQIEHAQSRVLIQVRCGLISKNHPWALHDGSGNRHALPLSAAQLRWPVAAELFQADFLQRFPNQSRSVFGRHFQKQKRILDVLRRGQHRKKIEGLKDETDFLRAQVGQLIGTERRRVPIVDENSSGTRPVDTAQQVQQSGLSASGAARNGEKIPLLYL